MSGVRKRDPGRGKRARVGPVGSDEGASGLTEKQAGSYVRLPKAVEQYMRYLVWYKFPMTVV